MGDGKKGKNKKKSSVPATQGNKVETNGTTPLQEQPEVQATPKPAEPKDKPIKPKEKRNKKKSSKKPGLIVRLFAFLTLKRIIFTYILYVVFVCGDKSNEPRSTFNESVCSNGISRYILEHGLFQKYIEPSVILLKTDYIEPSVKVLNEKYEIHAKPIIDPLAKKAATQYEINAKPYVESALPHYETAKEYYYENVHTPVLIIWRDTKIWYKKNAKKHVDETYAQSQVYYDKAKVFLHPYWAEAQVQATKVYEYNKELYHQHVAPPVTTFYYKKVEPTAQETRVVLNEIYVQQIIPAYQYLESQVTKAIEFIRAQLRDEELEERKKKAKEEAERKAKAEAERKKSEEAKRKAKAEAERKAKEEAERKAKAEIERKAKEEAERKAKAEAERRAKADAEKKAKEEAAELAAIEAATFSVNNAAKEKIENLSNSISVTVEKFKKKIDDIKKDKLDHILSKVDGFQNSANQQLGELNKFAEQVKLDSKLNITDKKNNITTATKKVLEDVREKSKKILKDVEDLSEKITTEIKTHKQEIELVLTEQVDNTKSHLRKTIDKNVKADKSKLEDFEKHVDEVSKQAIADFTLVEIAAEEEIKRTSNKTISLVIQTSKDAAQSIYKARSAATDAFEKQHLELAKSSSAEKEKEKASDEAASTPDEGSTQQEVDEPVIVKTHDPILEKLRAGLRQKQDPVLAKLKENYQKMIEEKSEDNTDPPLDELDECEVQSQCGG